ncbi:hypothetical protein CBER1_11530 [Cercospora berteroae]|uniref:Uncharacterized protein n=1 Tax=Cercospora berteroae TaxID=357750 RepID=A0A2S6C0C5_9PEZI|nr:hypothetical protein CBER1_11530 [Cercospora berteroae]
MSQEPPHEPYGPLGNDLTPENFHRLTRPDPPANLADENLNLSEKWVFLRNKLKLAAVELKDLNNEASDVYLKILKRLGSSRDGVLYVDVQDHPSQRNPDRYHWKALIQEITPHTTGREFDDLLPRILNSATAEVGAAAKAYISHLSTTYDHLQALDIDSFELPHTVAHIYNSFHETWQDDHDAAEDAGNVLIVLIKACHEALVGLSRDLSKLYVETRLARKDIIENNVQTALRIPGWTALPYDARDQSIKQLILRSVRKNEPSMMCAARYEDQWSAVIATVVADSRLRLLNVVERVPRLVSDVRFIIDAFINRPDIRDELDQQEKDEARVDAMKERFPSAEFMGLPDEAPGGDDVDMESQSDQAAEDEDQGQVGDEESSDQASDDEDQEFMGSDEEKDEAGNNSDDSYDSDSSVEESEHEASENEAGDEDESSDEDSDEDMDQEPTSSISPYGNTLPMTLETCDQDAAAVFNSVNPVDHKRLWEIFNYLRDQMKKKREQHLVLAAKSTRLMADILDTVNPGPDRKHWSPLAMVHMSRTHCFGTPDGFLQRAEVSALKAQFGDEWNDMSRALKYKVSEDPYFLGPRTAHGNPQGFDVRICTQDLHRVHLEWTNDWEDVPVRVWEMMDYLRGKMTMDAVPRKLVWVMARVLDDINPRPNGKPWSTKDINALCDAHTFGCPREIVHEDEVETLEEEHGPNFDSMERFEELVAEGEAEREAKEAKKEKAVRGSETKPEY